MVIRMYKDVARFALLALAQVRDSGTSVADLLKIMRSEGYPILAVSPEEQRKVNVAATHLANSGFHYEASFNQVIEELLEQLQKADSPFADGSLIDEIIKILKLPYARNVTGPDQLNRLRKAILMPDEVAKINADLERTEAHCSSCARPFHALEMVTFIHREGREAERSFVCWRCQPPEFIPCRECGSVHQLTKSQKTTMNKGGKHPQAPEPQEPDQAAPGPDPVIFRVGNQQARAARPAARPAWDLRVALDAAAIEPAAAAANIPRNPDVPQYVWVDNGPAPDPNPPGDR